MKSFTITASKQRTIYFSTVNSCSNRVIVDKNIEIIELSILGNLTRKYFT